MNAFMVAKENARKKGEKSFTYNGKKYVEWRPGFYKRA